MRRLGEGLYLDIGRVGTVEGLLVRCHLLAGTRRV